MPQDDSFEVQFPLSGLDTASEYGVPRPGTTIRAFNCRSLDPLLERSRGGSRHGLIRYPDDRIPGSSTVVESFTAAGASTWTAPANLTGTVKVEIWGAGGYGTDGNGSTGGSAGGGGEYAQLTAFAAVPSTVYPFVIGSGDTSSGSDGEQSTFNTASLIANGGKGDGTGGTGGTGDVTFDGGAGGTSGAGLGGAGGGAAGGSIGAGDPGQDGQASNTGGNGAVGFGGGGTGGQGATGDVGSESIATAGALPGGGGAGGAFDTGGVDPSFLVSAKGGDGHLLLTYTVLNPIQCLAQLVILDPDYLLTSFENYNPSFVPDPSTSNFPDGNPAGTVPSGNGSRQPDPARDIPPGGGGDQPNRYMPPSPRRRVQIVPSVTTQFDGTPVTFTVTLSGLPGTVPTVGLVTINTNPPGRTGDGLSFTTTGAGTVAFPLSESSYEGTVIYTATHLYVDGVTGKIRGTRGTTKVTWKPNYTLVLTVPFTSHLNLLYDPGTNTTQFQVENPILARLTQVSNGDPVAGRSIRLDIQVDRYDPFTCSSSGFVPSSFNGLKAITDERGYAKFTRYMNFDFTKQVEQLTAAMVLKKTASPIEITSNTELITWYTEFCP